MLIHPAFDDGNKKYNGIINMFIFEDKNNIKNQESFEYLGLEIVDIFPLP